MSNESVGYLFVFGVIGLACGMISHTIAAKKNSNTPWLLFWLGFFLGPIGIIAAAVSPSGPPPPPKGHRRVECARCTAIQNVPETADSYECWQCHATLNVLLK